MQAAAAILAAVPDLPDLMAPPFNFPRRYREARELVDRGLRVFLSTSAGRLFDTAAALPRLHPPDHLEGQAAIWLEQLALAAPFPAAWRGGARYVEAAGYVMPFAAGEMDPRPLLAALVEDRAGGREAAEAARLFQRGFASGIAAAALALCRREGLGTVALSGGVFQNELLCADLQEVFAAAGVEVWTQRRVPRNDGGLSLGQAALAATGLACGALQLGAAPERNE